MRGMLKPKQRGIKTGKWAHQMLLAAWLLLLVSCGQATSPALLPTPWLTAISGTAPPPGTTPTPAGAPSPTPQPVASCAVDVLTYLFATEISPQGGNPELGRLVECREAYESAFGISPEVPYDPYRPETAINWYVQRKLATMGIQLARNGRAVVLPEFAQGIGIEEIIRRDAPEAQIFFDGISDGQAPATALRAVLHASGFGGYVMDMVDGAGNFYLLVGEGNGQTLGFPGEVEVDTATDVVRVVAPGGGRVTPVKVDGCDWVLASVDADGRVGAVLAVEPGAALAWQMNPNPPEAVAVPTATTEQETNDLPQSCFDQEVIQTTLDNYLAEHRQTYDQLAAEIQAEIDNEPFPFDEGPMFCDENEDGDLDTLAIHVFGRPIGVTTASIEHLPGTGEGDYVNCLLVANPRDGLIPVVVDGKVGGVWSPLTSFSNNNTEYFPWGISETDYKLELHRLIESGLIVDMTILSRIDELPFAEPNPLVDGHYNTNYVWFPPYYQYARLIAEQSYLRRTTENDLRLTSLAELRTMLGPLDIGFMCPRLIIEPEQ